jgi:hypothetical protein
MGVYLYKIYSYYSSHEQQSKYQFLYMLSRVRYLLKDFNNMNKHENLNSFIGLNTSISVWQ